jgi:uncharacterized membrane protein
LDREPDYNNPDDSDFFVPGRVGLGWTINVRRLLGKVILIATLLQSPALLLLKALSRGS